ncbi:MAG: hypothetical protein U9N56_02330 [Actinomycetota bacterium]|nr:hypothetical protein [Actinomycetota bacterium]
MRRLTGALLLLVAGCAATSVETTTTAAPVTTSTTIASTTTTRAPAVDECPPAPYEVGFLPVGVGEGGLDMSQIEPDVWTSVGGTQTTFFGRNDATVAIALIRGTLPAVDWPGEKGEIEIDGTRAAVGAHPDGTWVAGWFEAPGERCDLYSMVFYPPWNPSDVEQVLASMNRVGG